MGETLQQKKIVTSHFDKKTFSANSAQSKQKITLLRSRLKQFWLKGYSCLADFDIFPIPMLWMNLT